ncbi:unnamed protein product [Leuciscus chuanchicus]
MCPESTPVHFARQCKVTLDGWREEGRRSCPACACGHVPSAVHGPADGNKGPHIQSTPLHSDPRGLSVVWLRGEETLLTRQGTAQKHWEMRRVMNGNIRVLGVAAIPHGIFQEDVLSLTAGRPGKLIDRASRGICDPATLLHSICPMHSQAPRLEYHTPNCSLSLTDLTIPV